MNRGDGTAENWLADFTTALRDSLPQGQYILTHARELHFRACIELHSTCFYFFLKHWLLGSRPTLSTRVVLTSR